MSVPFTSNFAGVDLVKGNVSLEFGGDINYRASDAGTPEIAAGPGTPYSLFVTSQNAGKQQCLTAANADPDATPITNLHKGLLFCVKPQNGVALVEVVEPLGNSKTLYLRETYWPDSRQLMSRLKTAHG